MLRKRLTPFKAACIQFNPELNEREKNVEVLVRLVTEAAREGAKLIVTPEMATTGYHYRDRKAIQPFVETIPGVTVARFERIAEEYDVHIVISMPEVDPETDLYYIAAALVGPEGYIGKYRKTHLWHTEQSWASWGDLGIPVFDTSIGKIAINICMDAIYFESARLAAVQHADILVFPTNSTAQSISLLQDRAETNGLYVISANRSNTENGYHMVGASAIWSPLGEKLVEGNYAESTGGDGERDIIIYAEINPVLYQNEAKRRRRERRPELYKDLLLYVSPWDERNKADPRDVSVATIQYEPLIGQKASNLKKIKRLVHNAMAKASEKQSSLQLVVLPELSVTGPVDELGFAAIESLAETVDGITVDAFKQLASSCQLHIVFGWIEKDHGQLYNSAALVTPDGRIASVYRKTHLHPSERFWATPGHDISVYPSESLGRIGIMIGYDAAFPEVAGVLAIHRADILAVPSSWYGEFGRVINSERPLFAGKYPYGAVTTWDATAHSSQAYTVIANFVGTNKHYLGRSAVYTLNPHYDLCYPVVSSSDQEEVMLAKFKMHKPDSWFNQEKLISSRRTCFYKPLVSGKVSDAIYVEAL